MKIYVALFLAFIAFAAAGMAGCGSLASQGSVESLLQNQGFTNIEVTKREVWFVDLKGCGKDDVALFTAKATNPIGTPVTVEVCEGWPFKGATIRGN